MLDTHSILVSMIAQDIDAGNQNYEITFSKPKTWLSWVKDAFRIPKSSTFLPHLWMSIWGGVPSSSLWNASKWAFGNWAICSLLPIPFKSQDLRPGWCGSVDWAPTCKLNGHCFGSQSGRVPGLRGQVPSQGCTRGNHTWMYLSLSFSFPSALSGNK